MASAVLKKDLYVDNVSTGVNNKEEGQRLCNELINILNTAHIPLRQWTANNHDILKNISKSDLDVNYDLDREQTLKTLGISWNSNNDSFVYTVKHLPVNNDKLTRRIILSHIAKIFDPLGLLGPIILFAKKNNAKYLAI